MPLIHISTIFNIDLEFETTSVHKRILAYMVDFTLLLLYVVSMKFLYYGGLEASTDIMEQRMGIDILTISLPMLLYSLVSEVLLHGQTFGKKLLNIRVISLSGEQPSLSQFILRWMFKVFEWPFFFGYILFSGIALMGYIFITGFLGTIVVIIISATKKNQRIGDLAANTVVVNTKSGFSVKDTVFMDITDKNYKVSYPQVLRLSDRDINTIKNVLDMESKNHKMEVTEKVAYKVQAVLQISTDMPPEEFLNTLLSDYNFLVSG